MQFYSDEIDGDVLVLQVNGGLNEQTADEFVDKIEGLIEGGVHKLIIDCTQLHYISSYGLGVLIRIHHRMRKLNGDVKIASVNTMIAQAFQMTRLDRVFELYQDVSRAKLAFREPVDHSSSE